MTELIFDGEGVTDCPMNGKATKVECACCDYLKDNGGASCIYEDVFPELKDLMEAMNV